MKRLISAVILSSAILSGSAFATCYGAGSVRVCSDSSGNNYTSQRIGNSTYTTGTSRSGSSWSQDSTTIGSTTFHNGRAADGGSWNGTTTRIGDSSFTSGTNANGEPFSSSCIGAFCN